MQHNKANNWEGHKARRSPSLKLAGILLFVAVSFWLACTAYVMGQLEIRRSKLILTSEGCSHLQRYNIIPRPYPDSDTCSVELPFRPNLFQGGGLVRTGLGTVNLPECQLVSYLPVEEQHWWSERWPLVLWEAMCTGLLLYSMRLFGTTADGRDE